MFFLGQEFFRSIYCKARPLGRQSLARVEPPPFPEALAPNDLSSLTRVERKYWVPVEKTGYMLAWLAQRATPDSSYPTSLVSSIYFDTPDLEMYNEALDGDYCRNKVRVRWYDRPNGSQQVPLFVELKSKRGVVTHKWRERREVLAHELQPRHLLATTSRVEVERTLLKFGYVPLKPLRPVILITYRRHRFRDLATGMSLNFDLGIGSILVDGGGFGIAQRLEPRGGILEAKVGAGFNFPNTLAGLSAIAQQYTSFSKYVACIDCHLERYGQNRAV